MKRLLIFLFLVSLSVIRLHAQFSYNVKAKAEEIMFLFKTEKYGGVESRLDPTMSRLLDKEKLEGFWVGLSMRFGAIKSIEPPVVVMRDTLALTRNAIQFEKTRLILKIVLDRKGKIAGMFIEPVEHPYLLPAYVNSRWFYEVKKPVMDAKFPSEGMLTIPSTEEHPPLVIIVGGSGPTDKDMTIGPNKVYKDLAWGLATNGVATYRYDKRTVAYGTKMGDPNKLTAKEEYLNDLNAVVKYFRTYEGIDTNRIYVLGHSEGGYLVPYFEKNIKGIYGYILLAANFRNLEEIIPEQMDYLKEHAGLNTDEKPGTKAPVTGQPQSLTRHYVRQNNQQDSTPFGISAAYLQYLRNNSPAVLRERVMNVPLLVLQGKRDYQVTTGEYDLWKKALENNSYARFILYPELNHLFLPGKGISLPDEYTEPNNVPEYVIKDIVQFIGNLR